MSLSQGSIVFNSNTKGGALPPGAGNVKVLDLITDILPFDGTNYDEIIVKDPVRGGAFLKYAGVQVNDNGVIFTDSTGQLWKRIIEDDFINIQWFGAIGVTITQFDSLAPFNAALAAALIPENVSFPNIYIPGLEIGYHYYFSDTIIITDPVNIFGDGNTSLISTESDTTGIYFTYSVSDYSRLSHLKFDAFLSGAPDPTKHGIETKSLVFLTGVTVAHFGGNGFEFLCNLPTGNCNNSQIIACEANENRIHGFHLQGSDANHMNFSGCSAVANGGCGLADDSFLGNSHFSWHAATNGSTDIAWQRGIVQNGVDAFQALQDNFSGQPLTDPAFWYNLGPGLLPYAPAYNPATVYYRAASYFLTGLNQYSVLLNCYGESDQAPAHISQRSLIISGLHANFVVGLNLYADQQNLILEGGPLQVNDTRTFTGVHSILSYLGLAIGKSVANEVVFAWIESLLAVQLAGNSYIFGPASTALMQGRTIAAPGLIGYNNGYLQNTLQNRAAFLLIDGSGRKPAPGGAQAGDQYLALTNATQYQDDKPEVITYRNLDGTQWARILGFCEYEFTTNDATPFAIFQDSLYDGIIYNSNYEIFVLAVNPANGDAYTETRIDLVSFRSGVGPPAPINCNVKDTAQIAPVFQETSLVGATCDWNLATPAFELLATGIAATTINWKVQVKRIRL